MQLLQHWLNAEISTIGERLDKTYRQISKVSLAKSGTIHALHDDIECW
jgi:hypothetical protein